MLKVISKKQSNTGELIYLVQSSNNNKFGVGEYDSETDKLINTQWFINYQEAVKIYNEKLGTMDNVYNKCDLYTIDDWRNDGTLKVKVGQCIDDDVFEELSGSVPPRSYSRRCFQPGEAQCPSVDGEELYKTFTNINGNWKYLGLCKGGDTTPQKPLYDNMNENKNTIKLTESQFKKIIKESVNTIISKLNEDFDPYGIVEWNHFDNDNFDTDYYNGFVVVDSTRAVLGNFDDYNEAVEYARELASKNKYGTYEVYGCDEDGYALEEDYPEDNTLVYSTDEDFQ